MSLRFYPIYKLTKVKQQALKDFIRENLQLRKIKPSQSSAGYPVLFIPKKNRKLKMCINYRQLNSIIKKD
jgi:ethanolamine utilization protein EutA (predicted chaperonin)